MTDRSEKVPITDPPEPKVHDPERAALSQKADEAAQAFKNRLVDVMKSRETPELIDKITETQHKVAAEALQPELPPGVTAEVIAQATAMEQAAGPVVRQVIGTVLRGLLVLSPGVPPQVLLAIIAWQTGNLLAGAFQSDLATTLTIRKNIKDGFADGITKTPIAHPPMPGRALAPGLPGMPTRMNGRN
jgi:hypothetical protein